MQEGLQAETVLIKGNNGDQIRAYVARPTGGGSYPGVLLIHHAPGWDQWYKEATLRFARHGYIAIAPNLYERNGHGTPEDVGAAVRAEGGVPDAQVVGDCQGAIDYLRAQSNLNGKVGVIGTCSGGRHTVLVASLGTGVTAAADLWGGAVVMKPEELTEKRPVAPVDYTDRLNVPLLGIFGNDDRSPSPEQVNQQEEALKAAGKVYEFHRYDGAGHGFFYYDRPNYRQEQAVDGWKKVWDFFGRHLS
ncbi:MAG: dienelactone hydrolase family protein [Chloroflexi bacterium]|nr:dienelactone hydrolase family protein [Chloroflexota bacterium]